MSACFRWGRACHALDRLIEVTSSGKHFAAARLTRDPAVMAHGTVKFFKPDKGWGPLPLPICQTALTHGYISAQSRWAATVP
jgi:hypothetical protein